MKRIITSLALFSALVSCTVEKADRGEGQLALDFSLEEVSKAAMSTEELVSSARVSIYNGDFSGMVRQYRYSEAPQTIYLPVESYRVDVEAGECVKENPAAASWEQKSYKGSANFSITAGAVTPVEVKAKVSNAVTRIDFDGSVDENLNSDFTLTIGLSKTDASSQLKYTLADSGREGYFILSGFEPSLYWSFEGSLRKDNSSVSKSGEIVAVKPGHLYKMTPKFTVRDGELQFQLMVDNEITDIEDIIIFEPVSSGLNPVRSQDVWAGHVTVYADVDETEYEALPSVVFSYTEDGTVWKDVDGTRVDEGEYKGLLDQLSGSTDYTCRLLVNGVQVGETISFTSAAAVQLPNGGFEAVSNAESQNWTSFFDPADALPENQVKFWDSGSSASAGMLGKNYAICHSDTDVPEGIGSTKSAKLTSISAAGKLAAGNLFTGSFAGLDGLNGKVNFGRAFTARPTALRFWYKYKGGKVDKTASGCPLTTDDYDVAMVQIALGTWDYRKYNGSKESPVQVNTSKKETLWDYQALPETIAYGKFEELGDGQTGEWKQVTVKLDYSKLDATPAFIVVSCAASKYGDYFAGSSSSILWLDEMELIYE